jgi:CubicO group peptidase (beta-lactamase class C family)
MKRALLLILAVAIAAPASARSQSLADDPRVASALNLYEIWLEAQLAYEGIPGFSAAIVHDQDLVWSKGFGFADPEKGIPATPRTIYSICSISKLFTSIGVLQQRDRGRVRLDDPVGQHLPWFDIERTFPDAPPVTIQGILTHSSGLPRESDHPYWSAPDFKFPSREEIIDGLSNQEMLYPGFTYFQYSNLGLTLAGEIVARVSDQPYGEYIRQHILDPLGMDDTYPEIPADLWGSQMAVGYGGNTRERIRRPVPMFQARGIAPAAGFASTVEDLAKFASWQIRLLEEGEEEILQRNTLREMHRVHWLDPNWRTTWGLGFSVWRTDDKTFVGHGGSCPGYLSHFALRPQEKFAAIFMVNALSVSSSLYTRQAYQIVGPAIAKAVASPGEGEAPDPELEIYTGAYGSGWGGESVVLVWEGQLATVSFPTENPMGSLTKYKKTGEHTFRRIRSDGELGEAVVFTVEDGEVVRMTRNSNHTPKIR